MTALALVLGLTDLVLLAVILEYGLMMAAINMTRH